MKKEKDKKDKKGLKKLWIVIIVFVIIALIVASYFLFFNKSTRVYGGHTKEFAEAIGKKEYYMKVMKLDEYFNETDQVVEIARDDNTLMMTMGDEGLLIKGGYYYGITNSTKSAYRVEKDSTFAGFKLTGEAKLETASLINSGTEIIKDEEYTYDQYANVKIYTKDNKLVYMDDGTNKLKIIDFSSNPSSNQLSIPDDYSVQDLEVKK